MEKDMSNEEKCLIEKSKRTRVGGTGPRRNELVTFKKLGEVSDEVYEYLNRYLDENPHSDIGSDDYAISKSCNYEKVFNVGQSYRQVILQKNTTNNLNVVDEYLYSQWVPGSEIVQEEMKKFFNNVYRFRLSEMQPEHTLNWHIDADTSVICRAQICLNENNSTFLFKDKEGIKEFKMKPKELWFVNTGWSHTVTNDTANVRKVAILGFHYDNLTEALQKEITL
jgi:hypothetical protein